VLGFFVQVGASRSQASAAPRRCSWQVVPRRFPELYDLAALGSRNVWVFGEQFNQAGDGRPIVLHWLGRSWRRVAVPKGASFGAADFVRPTDAWAVGGSSASHWDGRAWTARRIPEADGGGVSLYDVDVARSNDAWAVGSSPADSSHGRARAQVVQWDGARWSVSPTPDPGQSQLVGVAAIADNDVWAVGNQVYRTLIEHWDGQRWEVIPDPSAPFGQLRGIVAISARDVWIIGHRWDELPYLPDDVLTKGRALIQHWDGAKWQDIASPFGRRSVNSIAAVSSRDIWFSAGNVEDAIDQRPLLAHRIGATWRMVPLPRVFRGFADVQLAAAGHNDIWAINQAGVIGRYTCR
jgi:hypothetical protein